MAGRYSEDFLECLDRALMLRVEDRWQSAEEWLHALSGRGAKVPAPDVPSPPPQAPAPRPVVPAVDSVSEILPSPEFEQSAGSRKSAGWAIPLILLCGVLLLFAIRAMVSNDESDDRAANVGGKLVDVEEAAQDPSSTDTRDSEPVREETSVTQPGEERDFEIAPGVKMTMCWIPPGEFMMGSPEGETGRQDDEVQHRVRITKGFWLGKYEVTQAQWGALMEANPSHFKGGNLPVETVSWNNAQDFLVKLNARLGSADGGTMGLPTEAQWEYAARAGQTGRYAGGSVGSLDDVAWYHGNSGFTTHPVGLKKANAWGLHDMSGNVFEWCGDWYGDTLPGGVDPKGPASGSGRVVRGGGWGRPASGCRVAIRYYGVIPTSAFNSGNGFRVARITVP
jgi:formylglycine-generating enzyme required for sulfatase activity